MAVFVWESVKVCVCCIDGLSLFFQCHMWWLLAFVWRFLRWKGDRRCVKSQKIRQVAFAARKFFGGEVKKLLFHDLLLCKCLCLTQMMSKCVSRLQAIYSIFPTDDGCLTWRCCCVTFPADDLWLLPVCGCLPVRLHPAASPGAAGRAPPPHPAVLWLQVRA